MSSETVADNVSDNVLDKSKEQRLKEQGLRRRAMLLGLGEERLKRVQGGNGNDDMGCDASACSYRNLAEAFKRSMDTQFQNPLSSASSETRNPSASSIPSTMSTQSLLSRTPRTCLLSRTVLLAFSGVVSVFFCALLTQLNIFWSETSNEEATMVFSGFQRVVTFFFCFTRLALWFSSSPILNQRVTPWTTFLETDFVFPVAHFLYTILPFRVFFAFFTIAGATAFSKLHHMLISDNDRPGEEPPSALSLLLRFGVNHYETITDFFSSITVYLADHAVFSLAGAFSVVAVAYIKPFKRCRWDKRA